MIKVFVVRGVGVCFVMDKGKRPDVCPEKYMKDIVVGNVQIMGAEDFMKENAVLREVSRPDADMFSHVQQAIGLIVVYCWGIVLHT